MRLAELVLFLLERLYISAKFAARLLI